MARGKGRSGRRYIRDAKGRFASKGYVGQTGGRGARLKSGKGNIRQVGGQKRGERHILRSPESKAAGKRSFDASVAHAKLTLPKNLGGQGMPRDSFLARAAKAKKTEANAAAKAARRKTGLPESSVRLSRRVKRDPNVGEKLKALSKPKSVDQLNDARKRANADLDQKRAAFFGTKYGTPQQKTARAALLAAEKRSDAATSAWRDAKAGITDKTPKGSRAAIRSEQAKGRVQQFTAVKKSVDTEIRQVRQQIKDARKNATTFGAVPGLKLKLLSLQGKSKEYKATIERAKREIKNNK